MIFDMFDNGDDFGFEESFWFGVAVGFIEEHEEEEEKLRQTIENGDIEDLDYY